MVVKLAVCGPEEIVTANDAKRDPTPLKTKDLHANREPLNPKLQDLTPKLRKSNKPSA